MGKIRKFETGATRDTAEGKPDLEGYYSPDVVARFCRYMLKNQKQSDGTLRTSDNWQKGIPKAQYMKSLSRHFLAVWLLHRGFPCVDVNQQPVDIEEALCGILFNAQGYLFELLKEQPDDECPPSV